MATTEVKVPDIGNYTNIPVIEVLVKPGDTVAKDQGLVTLESDKATMEVPSSVAGVVKEVKVKVGDEISEGSVVALIEAGEVSASPSSAERGKVPEADGGASSKPVAPQASSAPPP
ncbi:MAG TPA: biotin/lipoyl-containing protein, partial [Rudaea sp.]